VPPGNSSFLWMTEHAHGPLARVADEVKLVLRRLRPTRSRLDERRLALLLNLDIAEHEFRDPVRGAAIGTRAIVLDSRLTGFARQEVLAHELAHILHARGWFRAVPAEEQELFADQFARELLLPREWLLDTPYPASLVSRLSVTYELVALQLAVLGHVPQLLSIRGEPVCGFCGPRRHTSRCSSAATLAEARRAGHNFPDVRELVGGAAPTATDKQMQLELEHAPDVSD
jgi:hypothetical protein